MIFTCALARAKASVGALLHRFRGKQLPLERIWFYSAPQSMNGIDKLIDILEALVNRRVTQISDFINLAQFVEHFRADHRRGTFAPAGFQVVYNFVYHIFQCKQTGGTLFKCFGDTGSQFTAVERLMGSSAFYHAQIRALDLLVGRIAVFALQTLPPPTDARAVARLTGINDLIITRPAFGATHSMKTPITIPFVVASILFDSCIRTKPFWLCGHEHPCMPVLVDHQRRHVT